MKTKLIWAVALVAILAVGCKKDQPVTRMKIGGAQPGAVLILSIPDWALGKYLTDSLLQASQNPANLKALRNFDNDMYKVLLADSNVVYVYTKKFNPCCPCSATKSSCCLCTLNTTFAAPRAMNASVKMNGTNLDSQSKQTDGGEVVFFNVPPNTPIQGLTLTIEGTGIIAPLEFSFAN